MGARTRVDRLELHGGAGGIESHARVHAVHGLVPAVHHQPGLQLDPAPELVHLNGHIYNHLGPLDAQRGALNRKSR